MEISLIRHGKSQLTENDTFTCLEFKQWVERYDCNGVLEESQYPHETLEIIGRDLLLQPFPQLIFLSRLLNEEAELMERFIDTSLN